MISCRENRSIGRKTRMATDATSTLAAETSSSADLGNANYPVRFSLLVRLESAELF